MENLKREVIMSDEPLDLSIKMDKKIVTTFDELKDLLMKAETQMPNGDVLTQILDNEVSRKIFKRLSSISDHNNSWQIIQSLLVMQGSQQAASQNPADSMNAVDEDSIEPHDQQNITPNAKAIKRPRSSMDKPVETHKRVEMEEETVDFNCPVLSDNDGVSCRIIIGINGTSISRRDWNSINWKLSPAAITRKLLLAVFDRHTLAHNTLSGKPSPAFVDCKKPVKGKLDPKKIEDIMTFMTTHFEIRHRDLKYVITSKCADEAKTLRKRQTL